ncbi:MAG: aminoglycoside phosphotransferase family protein [Patescibacteria group bacterium]
MKLGGMRKEYEQTETTFTKKGMWPERHAAEMRGLTLAGNGGICTPRVLKSGIGRWGGWTVMERIYAPRVDQVLWGNPQPSAFQAIGSTLADIHGLTCDGEPTAALINRRFQDLQTDVLRRSNLPEGALAAAAATMSAARLALNGLAPVYIHGDYTIQNLFSAEPMITYDWEHSGVCWPVYDIGASLSFMILLVTDGGWSYRHYFDGLQYFLDGYRAKRPLSEHELRLIDAYRFLGHRQVPQYYLFVLEYLARHGCSAAADLIEGRADTQESGGQLVDLGISLDGPWFAKLRLSFAKGGYRVSEPFWRWHEKEIGV